MGGLDHLPAVDWDSLGHLVLGLLVHPFACLPRLRQDLPLVQCLDGPVFHDDPPVDDDGLPVGSVGISGQLCCDVEGGGEVELVEVYDGEVGSLARLYGSRLILDVEGFCSVDGGHLQEALGGGRITA